jgi:hypothetical protein
MRACEEDILSPRLRGANPTLKIQEEEEIDERFR